MLQTRFFPMKQVQGQKDRKERNVIASPEQSEGRSNLIFNLLLRMKRIFANIKNFNIPLLSHFVFLLLTSYFLLLTSFLFAQQTYDLEIIFKRTNWNPDSIRCYGNALSTAGDLNQDGYDDIVYSVFFDNWFGYGYVFWGGNPMDTFPDLILKCEWEGQPLISICSGDLNGDGISDVIIGQGQTDNWGKVFIYFGGQAMDSLPDITLNGEPLN
ncbi:MAG: FG-GAP repeat protein, partial [candidate division WOR-3 bacterium]